MMEITLEKVVTSTLANPNMDHKVNAYIDGSMTPLEVTLGNDCKVECLVREIVMVNSTASMDNQLLLFININTTNYSDNVISIILYYNFHENQPLITFFFEKKESAKHFKRYHPTLLLTAI
jgi:hypothetical protein